MYTLYIHDKTQDNDIQIYKVSLIHILFCTYFTITTTTTEEQTDDDEEREIVERDHKIHPFTLLYKHIIIIISRPGQTP